MIELTKVREELARQVRQIGECGGVECDNFLQRLHQEASAGVSGQHEVVRHDAVAVNQKRTGWMLRKAWKQFDSRRILASDYVELALPSDVNMRPPFITSYERERLALLQVNKRGFR